MNYAESRYNYKAMCYIWLARVIKHAPNANIIVYYETHRPTAVDLFPKSNITVEKRSSKKRFGHHNLDFKLWNLSNTGLKEFLFLDADMYVIEDLEKLWKYRKDKPWIAVDHQWIPKHPDTHKKPFLNSGMQLVGDTSIYKYDAIIKSYKKGRTIPGMDQHALYNYFELMKYNYRHKDVGMEWNSCAAVGDIKKVDKDNFIGHTKGLKKNHPVYINHYWWDYKPWKIGCPIHKHYKDLL